MKQINRELIAKVPGQTRYISVTEVHEMWSRCGGKVSVNSIYFLVNDYTARRLFFDRLCKTKAWSHVV
jgi:hypothetical protein